MFWSITDWLDIIEEKEGGGRSVIWIQMEGINNQRIAAQKADGGGRDHLFPDLGVVSKESFIWDTDWDKYYGILRQSAADVFILISNWVIVAHEEESPTYEDDDEEQEKEEDSPKYEARSDNQLVSDHLANWKLDQATH